MATTPLDYDVRFNIFAPHDIEVDAFKKINLSEKREYEYVGEVLIENQEEVNNVIDELVERLVEDGHVHGPGEIQTVKHELQRIFLYMTFSYAEETVYVLVQLADDKALEVEFLYLCGGEEE